jgi:hypothetical protein
MNHRASFSMDELNSGSDVVGEVFARPFPACHNESDSRRMVLVKTYATIGIGTTVPDKSGTNGVV